jgi:cyclohexyl-isocyanide hydratase
VVQDGKLITSGGVTSGIDFALTVVTEIAGQQVAESIQLGLEYDPHPPFNSGHPDVADPKVIALLHERVYEKQVQNIEDIID